MPGAEAATVFDGDGANFAKHQKTWRVESEQIDIGDHQGPDTDAEFGEELPNVGRGTDAPAFGVEYLAQGGGGGAFFVEDEDVYRVRDWRSRGRHFWSIGG